MLRSTQSPLLILPALLVLLLLVSVSSFLPQQQYVPLLQRQNIYLATQLREFMYPWEGPLRDAKMQKVAEEETLLKIHCQAAEGKDLEQEVLPVVQKYVQSFPFGAVLPVQPLQYMPTKDGGVELLFMRKKTKEKGSVDGGLRFFVLVTDQSTGDLEIVIKRNSEGQTITKMFAEKLVVQAFVQSFTGEMEEGQDVTNRDPPTKEIVKVESVFHKWMDTGVSPS